MAQEQPRWPEQPTAPPIKYGDVFMVSEQIANKPIAPQDAAAMQSAENQVLGHTQRGAPATIMQSAAGKNVQAGAVKRGAATDVGREEGMTVTETVVDGRRVVTECVGDQVVARYAEPNPNPIRASDVAPPTALDWDAVTIGEALEATALSAGDKPIEQSDAAAIQTAEMRAIGSTETPPEGLGAKAQSAATWNARVMSDELKTTLGDVLGDATTKLTDDKAATLQDAEGVIAAEIRNNPKMATNLGGVGESVAAAARVNQQKYRE